MPSKGTWLLALIVLDIRALKTVHGTKRNLKRLCRISPNSQKKIAVWKTVFFSLLHSFTIWAHPVVHPATMWEDAALIKGHSSLHNGALTVEFATTV